jgi:hypothetical protein
MPRPKKTVTEKAVIETPEPYKAFIETPPPDKRGTSYTRLVDLKDNYPPGTWARISQHRLLNRRHCISGRPCWARPPQNDRRSRPANGSSGPKNYPRANEHATARTSPCGPCTKEKHDRTRGRITLTRYARQAPKVPIAVIPVRHHVDHLPRLTAAYSILGSMDSFAFTARSLLSPAAGTHSPNRRRD